MGVAVRTTGLGKRYRVGTRDQPDTLGGRIGATLKAPIRNLRELRSLTSFRDDDRDSIWALRDISFELEEGEVLGVVGRNGAGKSTLLKILSRTVDPTAGSADLWGRTASLLEVGTGFHNDLTGRENIFLNGAILGMRGREIEQRFDEIVEFSGVARHLDTPVKRYSSGMQLRLAFAVAAHLNSDILIADEVLAVGDAEFQRKCLATMRDAAGGGRTVIFVSHNSAAVTSLCTRAIWLERGRIRDDGPAEEVVAAYVRSIPTAYDAAVAARADREGDGRVRITNLSFANAAGEPTTSFLSGEDIEIHVDFERADDASIRTAYATVVIQTALGLPVTSVSSRDSGDGLSGLPPRGRFVCRLPRLPLNTGDYVCSAGIAADGQTADFLPDAAAFAVEALQFYPSGRHPDPQSASVLLDSTWRLEEPRA